MPHFKTRAPLCAYLVPWYIFFAGESRQRSEAPGMHESSMHSWRAAHMHDPYTRTQVYVEGFSDVHVKFISDVWMAGLLLPTPCRPRESGFGIGLGSDWSGPTYKVEIDHTTSFRADLHVGGAAIHLSLKFYGGVVAR